jgi:hypothetical protein
MDDSPLDLNIHSYYTYFTVTWDQDKSDAIKRARGYGFAEIVEWPFLVVVAHPTRDNQELILVVNDGYVWAVPAVIRLKEVFLKTAFPSRRYTKIWRQRKSLIHSN